MESALTKMEMDAVFQLIELRGGSADDLRVYWVNFKGEYVEEDEERSAADSSSSSGLINREKSVSDDEDDVLPRSKERFGSLVDIYRRIDDRTLMKAKRPRF